MRVEVVQCAPNDFAETGHYAVEPGIGSANLSRVITFANVIHRGVFLREKTLQPFYLGRRFLLYKK
jgi:hypothetical protein